MLGNNCDIDGVCDTWDVTTEDLTTGESTVLPGTTSSGEAMTWALAAAFEEHDVPSCDRFPGSGVTFYDIQIQGVGGNPLDVAWKPQTTSPPLCGGYVNIASGNIDLGL
jgi:hypothetical protein